MELCHGRAVLAHRPGLTIVSVRFVTESANRTVTAHVTAPCPRTTARPGYISYAPVMARAARGSMPVAANASTITVPGGNNSNHR
jgi:hypothetical protein